MSSSPFRPKGDWLGHKPKNRRRAPQKKRRLLHETLGVRCLLSGLNGAGDRSELSAVPGELLISYQAGVSDEEIASISDDIGLDQLREFDSTRPGIEGELQLVSIPAERTDAYISILSADPRVKYVEPNYVVSTDLVPNDPRFDDLWGLNNVGQTGGTVDADVDAAEAWNLSIGSTEIVVGVVDTGVDYTHSDLYLNVWLNQGEIPDFSGQRPIDTDGDGLVTFYDLNDPANSPFTRDINVSGYIDAGDLLADPRWADGVDGPDPGSFVDDLVGWDFANDDNDPLDDQGHGTHVSGTIGATGNNHVGVVGVNWRTQIMGLKFLSEGGAGTTADAISAIQYATQQGAQLTSNSWGGGGFSAGLQNAISASAEADMLFVAAAGNDGLDSDFTPSYPASYQLGNIIAVAATDHQDQLASFSNFGASSVDLGAPGVSVLSTTPNNSYSTFNGTSMATPHVSGTVALAWGVRPEATYQEVRAAVLEGVDTVSSLGGTVATGGRINALRAVQNVNPNAGKILLDRTAYRFPDVAQITVFDIDPDTDPTGPDTITVTVSSTTETTEEQVTLTETGPSTQQFTGTIELVSSATAVGDGKLQVVHGDVVVANYLDANPGRGPGLVTATAAVDVQRPVIDSVQPVPGARRATILWATDEPADSVVRYGVDPDNLTEVASSTVLTTAHNVTLFGLKDETNYFFEVTSSDAAGNSTNSAQNVFVTSSAPPILLVDDDQGEALERFFTRALDESGYIYATWDVTDVGSAPDVLDLADHSTVIWNTGANYDAPTAGLTAGEEASIREFLDGGGNLFLVGQDVIYNGVSSSFLSDYLHVLAFVEDVPLSQVAGVSGDPIGDGINLRLDPPQPFELDFADKLAPDAEGAASLTAGEANSGPSDVAVRYPKEGPSDFKTVFFAFPFESISTTEADPNNQVAIMERVMTWLGNDAPGRPGVKIEPTFGVRTSERGGSGDFTVSLKTEPIADVFLVISSGDVTEGLLSIGDGDLTEDVTLTFGPTTWDTPQSVTVTGVDDDLPDGNLTYLVVTNPAISSDPGYNGFDPVDVAVTNLEDAPFVEQGIVENVGSGNWTQVTLNRGFDSMVVVATPNYDTENSAGVVRIRNAAGNRFEVRVDSTNGDAISAVKVHYLVMEEGVYHQAEHGVQMEARKFNSTVTDGPGATLATNPDEAWIGELQTYQNSYDRPVVLGQVMSYNDPRWSVFWSRSDADVGAPPNDTIRVGKHVGEDPERIRRDETIGYVILESGAGTLGGFEYVADVGTARINGVGGSPPYSYQLDGLSSAGTAIATQSGMNGWNGGWAVLYGSEPVSVNSLNLAIDEDENDEERFHIGEQVAYLVFEREPNLPPLLDLDSNNSSGALGSNYLTMLASNQTSVPAVDSDAVLTDNSSDRLFSLVATITTVRDGEAELLSADTTGTQITSAYNPETGELTLSGFDTPASYQRVLRSIRYDNTAANRNGTARTITFVANDGTLRSNTAIATIVFPPPNQRPIAHPGGPYSIQNGASVLLNASQSVDPDVGPSPLTFEWDVNYVNGEFDVNATGRNPGVTWGDLQLTGIEPGNTYTVAVRAFDGADATIATTQLTVSPNQPPIVTTGGPYSIQPGWSLLLNSTGSFDPEKGASILTVEWDINYDGEFVVDTAGAVAPLSWGRLQQLGVKSGESHPIAVRVSDGEKETLVTTQVNVSGNQRPGASTGGPYTLQPGWTVFLRALGSFDPDFGPKPLTYQWDINYDGTFVEDATGQIVSMSWGALQQFGVEAGKTHPVALRVYDGAAEAFAFTTLSVAGAAGGLVAQSEVTQLAAIDQVIGADGDAYDDVGDEYSWL
jgi:subtilisin family serine protease